ncbi:hypothetical protein OF83DRAFT_44789 [Amylostereum chailletii]|nr:hypothetical protein OF83DRAFT_44789 [Amylostereum chailletii]
MSQTMANRPPYRDIHSLPVEVLSPIFCILSHMDTALDLAAAISYVKALWSRSLKPPKFIWHGKPILSVCHLWREIALGCPDFWKRMPVWSVEWTEMAISQTNGKPIIIDMSLPLRSIVNADALKLALLHVSRSEALTLYNSPSLNIVPYIRDAPAPSLRSFHFQSENIAVPAEEVEVQLFQGEALPLLRKVHVESLRLTSASQLLHCPLLYLHLQDCHGPVWQSLSDMHDTLSRMPALQYLSLQNTLPSTPLFPRVRWDRPAKITMESLSNLHMEGACLQVAAVLQSMVFPQHCKIRLDVTVREHDLPECVAILKAELADHFSREPSGDEFTSLSIRDLPGASPPGPLLSFIAGRTRGAAGPGYDHLTLHIQWDVPLERRIACLTRPGARSHSSRRLPC